MSHRSRIPKLTIVYMLVLIPFMRINALNQCLPNVVYEAWQVAGMLCTTLLVLRFYGSLKVDRYVLLFVLFQGIVFISTIRHQRVSLGILNVIVLMICLALLLQIHKKYIISAIIYIIVPIAILNCGTMFLGYTPDDLDNLFGGSNQLSMLLVPSVFLLYIYRLQFRNKKKMGWGLFFYTLIVVASIFKGGSATGIIVVVFACFVLWFYDKRKPNVKGIFLGIMGFNFLLVVSSSVLYNSPIWINTMEWLGKDASLSSRNVLWQNLLEMLERYWVFGVGRGFSIELISRYGELYYFQEAHNFWLEILCEAGVIGLGIYLYMFSSTIFRLDMSQKIHRIIFMAIGACMVNGLTEANNNLVIVNIILALANVYIQEDTKHACKRNEMI